ncbi:MAG: S-layer homology domain-containing protein [Oscillospiraceae bacterium]
MKKRVLSLVLAVILIVGLLPTAAFASTNGKTADDAINWVRSLNGQPVGSGECVALIKAYYSYLGQTSPGGNGVDYWYNDLPAGWTRIPNAQPKKGDILVYGSSSDNKYGHVAIYESDYSTWHQNYAYQRKVVNVTNVKYNGFTNPYLGVIRPDFGSAVFKPDFIDIGTNIYRYIIRADKWMPTGTCYDQNAKRDVKIVNSGSSDPNMIWLFTRMGNDNSYVIQNAYNDYYLCYEGNCASQAKITTSNKLTSSCYWYVAYYNGLCKLVAKDSVASGNWLVIDCTGGYATPGTQLQLYANWGPSDSNGNAQLFNIYTVENYQKPAAPPKVEITAPSVVTVDEEFTISWTESPLQGKYDQREYMVHIRKDGSGYKTIYTTDTSVTVSINWPGDCTVAVWAYNTKYQNYSSNSSAYFRCNRATAHEHSYKAVVTAPTCTAKGYTTHTCACGDSYVDTYTDALGHAWDNGKVTKPATETEDGVKTFTCTRCGETKTEVIPATGSVDVTEMFTDVSHSWADDGIQYCVTHQLMSGIGNDLFGPKLTTTRAQIVQILYNLEGEPKVSGTTPFTDLTQDWYQDAVLWAYQTGVVAGTSSTTFEPDRPVTREQIAVILMEYVTRVLKLERTWKPANLSAFPDAGSVSDWAKDALADAVALGLISGASNGGQTYLEPQGSATREQVATILMEFCKNVKK